jgi:hypothetical protein
MASDGLTALAETPQLATQTCTETHRPSSTVATIPPPSPSSPSPARLHDQFLLILSVVILADLQRGTSFLECRFPALSSRTESSGQTGWCLRRDSFGSPVSESFVRYVSIRTLMPYMSGLQRKKRMLAKVIIVYYMHGASLTKFVPMSHKSVVHS